MCSPAYNIDNYQQFDNVNTQVAEQYHAREDRSDFTGSLCHMTQVHFMLTARFFMFLYNVRARLPTGSTDTLRSVIEQLQREVRAGKP